MQLSRLFEELVKLGHKVEGAQIQKGNEVTVILKFDDLAIGDYVPIVEMSSCKELFDSGLTYVQVAKIISDTLRNLTIPESIKTNGNYEEEKKNLILAVSPTPLGDGVVNTKHLDFYLYMRCTSPDGTSFKVTTETLKKWGMTASEAFDQAILNSKGSLMVYDSLSIFGISKAEKFADYNRYKVDDFIGLCISKGKYGASAIAMTDIFAKIAHEWNDDLLITALNVDQISVRRANGTDIQRLKGVIYDVNRFLAKENYLSDSVYMYSREEGKVIIVA